MKNFVYFSMLAVLSLDSSCQPAWAQRCNVQSASVQSADSAAVSLQNQALAQLLAIQAAQQQPRLTLVGAPAKPLQAPLQAPVQAPLVVQVPAAPSVSSSASSAIVPPPSASLAIVSPVQSQSVCTDCQRQRLLARSLKSPSKAAQRAAQALRPGRPQRAVSRSRSVSVSRT